VKRQGFEMGFRQAGNHIRQETQVNFRFDTSTASISENRELPGPRGEDRSNGRFRRNAVLLPAILLALVVTPALPGSIGATAGAAPKKQSRIVALTPFAANAMAQMGVFPKAIGQTLGGDRRYVSGLRKTPVLPMGHKWEGPEPERLISTQPELIFTSPQWRKGRDFLTDVVKQNAGERGKVINADPASVPGAYAKVGQISRLINRKARGKRLLRQMKRSVNRNVRNVRSRPKVMVILGVGGVPYAFTYRSWAGEIVRRAGGRLLEGGVSFKSSYGMISNERIIKERPQVIIAIPHDEPEKITPKLKADMKEQWRSTPAARNNRIYFSTDNSLLQAGTDIGATIRRVRGYLGN
jgi:iron complex transport system substrate-binding protein